MYKLFHLFLPFNELSVKTFSSSYDLSFAMMKWPINFKNVSISLFLIKYCSKLSLLNFAGQRYWFIEKRTWTFIVLLFYSIFNFYNIKLTLIVCKIFQFLYKVFYGSFSWFCEKDKRKVILFQSSSIHCDIVGRSFSVLNLLLILLRNSLGKSAVT